MAAVSSSKGHKSSRLLRPVADSDYDSLSEIASELTNLPRNSFVNGYKFFADSLLRDVEGKLTLLRLMAGEPPCCCTCW